jgi:hypothetical protein
MQFNFPVKRVTWHFQMNTLSGPLRNHQLKFLFIWWLLRALYRTIPQARNRLSGYVVVTKCTQNYIITKVPKTTTDTKEQWHNKARISKESLLVYLCIRLDIWWKRWETLAKEAGNQMKCEPELPNGAVAVVTAIRVERIRVPLSVGNLRPCSGVHPAYISTDTAVLSRDTAARASRDLSHPSSAEVETEWRCTSTPPIWLHDM